MKQFKPTIALVEAEQYDGSTAQQQRLAGDVPLASSSPFVVQTPDGDIEVRVGDWLVRNRAGDVSVLTDEAFRLHYEPV